METIRTASIKLNVDSQTSAILLQTIENYTKAYNFCSKTAFDLKLLSNGLTLHKLCYTTTREYLPSQLAISARDSAINSIKGLKTKIKKETQKRKYKKNKHLKPFVPRCPNSKRQGLNLCGSGKSYSLWWNKGIISILTCQGRIKINIPDNKRFWEYSSWKYLSAVLVYRKGKFFLNVQFSRDVADIPRNGKMIGIDRGIKKLAVTSDNRFFLGGKTKQVCIKYQRMKNILQSVGTRSAKRHLCKLKGKEKRFKADVNHCISKKIVSELYPGDTIVLEDLSDIRDNRTSKKQRTAIHHWSYYQLEQFIKYKTEEKSIYIEYVDARYTSQRCSHCGFICRSNRKTQSCFDCKQCGFKLNADLNAARNIVLKHLDAMNFPQENSPGHPGRAAVNQPCGVYTASKEKIRRPKWVAKNKPTSSSCG